MNDQLLVNSVEEWAILEFIDIMEAVSQHVLGSEAWIVLARVLVIIEIETR